jgi:hypothetical protein
MRFQHTLGISILASIGAMSSAGASTVFTVTAAYDPFMTANTSITVTNTSGVTETNVDLFSGGTNELLGTIAAGASVTYEFNENSGPFIDGSGSTYLADTTSYEVSASYLGATLTTAAFSPVSNLTGGYVDFLGACYLAENCSVDPSGTYPLSGVVAQAVAPVPLPPSLALITGALVGLGAIRRRK